MANNSDVSVPKSPAFTLSGADGVRAIACLMVIFHHIFQRLMISVQPPWLAQLQSFIMLGSSGVSVFFVLSGFLLSYPFWKNYLQDKDFPSIKIYSLRRAARIMPGYYLNLILSFVLVLLFLPNSEAPWIRFLAGMTFTAGFHYVTFFPNELNSPLWSISFEVFSYLLMPLFMAGLYYFTGKKRSFIKAFLFWTGVLALVFFANQLVHQFFTPDNYHRGFEYGIVGGAKLWMPNYNPAGFFAHFALGIIAAGVVTKLSLPSKNIELLKNKGFFDILALLTFIGIVVFLWINRGARDFSVSFQNQPYFFPFFAGLVALLLCSTPLSRYAGKILDNPFFEFTAKISFGLYIWHFLIIQFIQMNFLKSYVWMGVADIKTWAIASIALLILSYAAASLSWFFIEKPILNWAHSKK